MQVGDAIDHITTNKGILRSGPQDITRVEQMSLELGGYRVDSLTESYRASRAAPLSRRRLADVLIFAVHQACDQGDTELAWGVLRILDSKVMRPQAFAERRSRRDVENIFAAHERLWLLRHPNQREH